MPLNIVSFFLNFARTILAPTVINQQKFSFFLQDQEGTKAGCKPTTTDLIHLSTEEYEHLLSDEEYEHDDSADSLRVKLPECLILRHLLQEAYRIIAKELPHGGGVAYFVNALYFLACEIKISPQKFAGFE